MRDRRSQPSKSFVIARNPCVDEEDAETILSGLLELTGYLERQRAAIAPSQQCVGASRLDFADQPDVLTGGLLDRGGQVVSFGSADRRVAEP